MICFGPMGVGGWGVPPRQRDKKGHDMVVRVDAIVRRVFVPNT